MTLPSNFSAVVTGAGSGLGRALADEIASRGGRLVISDIHEENLAETADKLRRQGAEVHSAVCDVSRVDEVRELAELAELHLGPIDLLCNNAGVAVGGGFESISLEDWEWIVGINLWGVIYGCRAFLPAMRKRGSGHILNVASAAGLLRAPNMTAYNVTKVGVVGLSETLYAEYKPHGVHVGVLCPTFFRTNIMENSRGEEDPKMKHLVGKWMDRSKVQAKEVAQSALRAMDERELYIVPMRDGRMMWRMKRAAPQRFHDFLVDGQTKIQKLFARR
ncbi:MAG: SDR family oxidoreductase [Myxococcota bacterium]